MDGRTSLKNWLVMAMISLGFGCAIAAGDIIYVDADAPPAGDGTSWGTAYKYLQDALDDAESGDEIWVAEGIYRPDDDDANHPDGSGLRTDRFQLINGVAIYGGFAGGETSLDERDWQNNETILSGDIGTEGVAGDNSYHVVTGSGTNATAVLDGFTITAGKANGSGTQKYGGGMYNDSGSPTITNCTFSDNSAMGNGGGMRNYNSSPTVTNCTFSDNSTSWCGGGMYNYQSSSKVANCTFSGNSAFCSGGGMSNCYHSSPTLTNCTFSQNSASAGGGMNNSSSSPAVTNCTFSGNSAGNYGGGMYNNGHYEECSPTVTNCTFSGNSSACGGGMANREYSSPMVTNCTFSGNEATNGNALGCDSAQQLGPSNVQLASCILWDGGNEIWNNDGSTITITYSDVQGGCTGTGNIDEDPLFIDPNGTDGIPGTADDEESNVHLRGYSPCINAGDPSGDYSGQVDLDGQPRVAYGRVDIGADEVFPIAGDFEPDGDVDFADFAIFANHWLLGAQ